MDAKQGLRYDKVDFERIRGVDLSTFLHYVDVLSLVLRYSLISPIYRNPMYLWVLNAVRLNLFDQYGCQAWSQA